MSDKESETGMEKEGSVHDEMEVRGAGSGAMDTKASEPIVHNDSEGVSSKESDLESKRSEERFSHYNLRSTRSRGETSVRKKFKKAPLCANSDSDEESMIDRERLELREIKQSRQKLVSELICE